jgi:serine protease DegQ
MWRIDFFVFLLLVSKCFANATVIPQPHESVAAIDNSNSKPLSSIEYQAPTLCALSADIQNLWNLHKDVVVKVMGNKKDSRERENLLFGTGFFADGEGNILTTATITTEAENLWVEYRGLSYAATVIGKDPVTNIAVIRTLKKPQQFTFISLEQSSCDISEGSLVVSIGCVLGMEPTPELGLITGKNIAFGDRIFAITYLRSNIAIIGGESGAPVLSSDGRLCGILIASLPELHSSFIIPQWALARLFSDIIHNKSVKYCSAGFSVRGNMSETREKEVIISAIDEQKIKYNDTEVLQMGDIIVSVEAQKIRNESDIADILFSKKPKDILMVQIMRNQKMLQVAIMLGEKTF